MTTGMNIGGIILAAGGSARMGKPKALLELSGKKTLLASQADLLARAGCAPVIAVVGSNADKIMDAHRRLEVSWCINPDWKEGQFSSIRCGVSELLKSDVAAAVILPVDAAGIKNSTLSSLFEAAEKNRGFAALVPVFGEKGGHPVCLSRSLCAEIEKTKLEGARLDLILGRTRNVIRIVVDDKNILHNINTPDDWRSFGDAS